MDQIEKESKQVKSISIWNVPPVDYYNENYEKGNIYNYAMDKCYLRIDRREPEKMFEEELQDNNNIIWWYKNGSDKSVYFAIPYIHPSDGRLHSFYPDYIVLFQNGKTGIFDTKAGFTVESAETAAKSNALQEYILDQTNNGKLLLGGIVNAKKSGLFVYEGLKYNPDTRDPNWHRLEL